MKFFSHTNYSLSLYYLIIIELVTSLTFNPNLNQSVNVYVKPYPFDVNLNFFIKKTKIHITFVEEVLF